MLRTLQARVIEYHEPGSSAIPIGVLVYDPAANELLFRFRDDLHSSDEFNEVYLQEFTQSFASLLSSSSPAELFRTLDDSLSNVLRIGLETELQSDNPSRELDALYDQYIFSGLISTELS